MLQETDQIQAHEELRGAPAGALTEPGGDFLVGVGPLTARPPAHEFLKGGNRWIEPRIIHRAHIDDRPHLGLRLTQHLARTLLPIGDPLETPGTPGRALHGTVIVNAPAAGPKAVAAHGEPGGAQGDAVIVDLGSGTCGSRVLPATGIQGDDGGDDFGLHKLVDAERIQPTVVHDGPHRNRQGMRLTGLEKAVQADWAHGEVGDMGGSEPDVDGQSVFWGDDTVLEVAMTEKVGVAVGIVPPGGRGVRIESLVVATENPLRPTITGRASVGTGPGRQGRAIPTEDERLEVAQEPTLDRGENATGEQEVFQAGEELLGARLVRRGKQLLGEPLCDGVRLAGLAGLSGMPLGLFLLEMTPMTPLAQAARADVVSTRWRIGAVFEAVNKGVEGPDRGRLEGREAGDLRQARMGAQVVGPRRETFVVEEEHQEQGPEHTDGVGGGPSARAGGIERAKQRPGRVQIEPQEDECSLVPWIWQTAGLAAQPALEFLGQGLAILGMREDHRSFLLGRKGKQGSTYGPLVPLTPASGKAPGFFEMCDALCQADVYDV